MNDWLNPDVDEVVSIALTSGVVTLHENYKTPHRMFVLKIQSDEPITADKFLLCVGCQAVPSSSPMSYRELHCRRRDAQSLLAVDEEFQSIVMCYAARVFDQKGLLHWTGQDGSNEEDQTCIPKL